MKPPIYQAAVRWFYLKLWYAGLFASTEPFEMLFGLHACSFRISVFKCIYYFLMCFVTTSHCCSVKCGHEIHGKIVQTVYDAAVEIISCCIGYLCMKFNVAAYISVKVITRTAVCHLPTSLRRLVISSGVIVSAATAAMLDSKSRRTWHTSSNDMYPISFK